MKDPRTPPPPPPSPSTGALLLAMTAGIAAGISGAPPAVPTEFALAAAEWNKGWLRGTVTRGGGKPHFGNLRIDYDWRK